MSLRVLKSTSDVAHARAQLRARGLSSVDGWWPQTAAKLGIRTLPVVGDTRKSWDVLRTAEFIRDHVAIDEMVVDIGARGSEMLPVLAKMGYSHLVGVDLDRSVLEMPRTQGIEYRVGDFRQMDLPAGGCGAVTAISVIEHGYDPHRLFQEVARVLRPGGHFVASFDYWPDKLDTDGRMLFGMSWRIFSESDVRQMVSDAAIHGLRPAGDLDTQATEPIVHFEGYHYTFAWMALTKG
jgi:SAM-dependent methyltransferase